MAGVLSRRSFLQYGIAATVVGPHPLRGSESSSDVLGRLREAKAESGGEQLQEAMRTGARTSRSICAAYLARIAELDPKLHAVLETNPDALAVADQLDGERRG